jgi:predicted GNAT superfamily acetyltransferase
MTLVKNAIDIQPLRKHEDLQEIVALQRIIWAYSDLEIDSQAMLTIASRFAGQVLGAFDQDHLIGFSFAVGVLESRRLHSHRVGVHPDYQNSGVGRMLKLAQRDDALKRGVDTIQWTFDPMQPRNAYFNIARLGGIAKTYIPNLYGITTSPLHGGLPTDRLLIEWHLQSEHVRRILAGERPVPAQDVRTIYLAEPIESSVRADEQAVIREQFLDCFNDGYSVCDFRKENGAYVYVLERTPEECV